MAVSFILILEKLECANIIGRCAGYCAPSMFTVYLLHDGIPNHYARNLYSALMNKLEKNASGIGAIFITAIAVFGICLAIDLIRRSMFYVGLCFMNRKFKQAKE